MASDKLDSYCVFTCALDDIFCTQSLQGHRGVSRQKVLKHISSNYEMKQGFESLVKQALKRCVSKNILVQVKGTGASGSFKVNKEVKNISKVRVGGGEGDERDHGVQ